MVMTFCEPDVHRHIFVIPPVLIGFFRPYKHMLRWIPELFKCIKVFLCPSQTSLRNDVLLAESHECLGEIVEGIVNSGSGVMILVE